MSDILSRMRVYVVTKQFDQPDPSRGPRPHRTAARLGDGRVWLVRNEYGAVSEVYAIETVPTVRRSLRGP